ncbi:hypothetical protein [Actinoplanes sp. CA-252034]|uniref:hypothetical protein n=1 Tax=Actinoplanes sp. CA-252034 TaxID=3239906 RepID=UPI003D96E689
MRFLLPGIAVGAWWYFAGTAVTAYHLAEEGVVVTGEVIRTDRFGQTENHTVRFTTSDGRLIETNTVPATCEVKDPGATVEIRYVASDPYTIQDTCDAPRHRMSVGAALAAIGTTALSVQAWRLWFRYRKEGRLPPQYPV